MKKTVNRLLSTLDDTLEGFRQELECALPPCPGRKELRENPGVLLEYLVDAAALLNGTVRVMTDVSILQIWSRHQLLLMEAKDRVRIQDEFESRIDLVKELEKTLSVRRRHLKEQISLYKTLMGRLDVPSDG